MVGGLGGGLLAAATLDLWAWQVFGYQGSVPESDSCGQDDEQAQQDDISGAWVERAFVCSSHY